MRSCALGLQGHSWSHLRRIEMDVLRIGLRGSSYDINKKPVTVPRRRDCRVPEFAHISSTPVSAQEKFCVHSEVRFNNVVAVAEIFIGGARPSSPVLRSSDLL